MKTIAVIGTRGFPGIQGGVEAHSYHLYTHMEDVHVRLYRRRAYLTEQSAQTFPNIEYVDLPSTRIKGFEAVWHTFLSVMHIAFHRPDVVHIHNIGPGMFAPLLRLMGLPVVLTYHSPNYEHSKWSAPARWLLRQCEKISLRCSNRVIFVNKHQMEKCGALDKSVFIPNGIDPVTRSESTSFLDKHGITPGCYLLAVGRLTPEKGLEYLVEAANRLPLVTQVVIAGASDHDSTYREQLERLDTHKKVIFTGFTTGEDLRQLYSHAQAFVLPSVNEGFPMVLLEAMAYGLPIVCSDIPGTRQVELPENNYFAVKDTEALCAAITRLLDTPNEPHHYNLTNYNWDSIAAEVHKQYELLTSHS
ncbi:MAG: glycosyltransferase family 4 protein [Muribaculaceae bacterium]|nr:glycosyltransferase family 4 protein [Muribaculaceae bacterium]